MRAKMVEALAVATGLVSSPAWGARDFSMVIPEDASVAVWATDVPTFRDALEKSFAGRLLEDEALAPGKQFISMYYLEMSEEDWESPEFKNLADGLSHLRSGFAVFEWGEESRGILAETDEEGSAFYRKKLGENTREDAVRATYDVLGTEVFRTESKWMVTLECGCCEEEKTEVEQTGNVGGVFFAMRTQDDDAVRRLVMRLKGEDDEGGIRGRADAAFAPSYFTGDTRTVSVFFDLGKWMRSDAEEDEEKMVPLRALGFDDLGALYSAISVSSDQIDITADLVSLRERRGLMKALTDGRGMRLDSFHLASSDCDNATAFRLDIGALFDFLLPLLDELEPSASEMVRNFNSGLEAELGVDILEGIVKQVAGEHYYMKRPLDPELAAGLDPMEALGTRGELAFYRLRSQDAAATLKTVIAKLQQHPDYGAMVEVEDQEGIMIVRVADLLVEEYDIPYAAIAGDRLMLAKSEIELRNGLRMLAGQADDTLAGNPDFAEVLEGIDREGLLLFSYTPSHTVGRILDQARALMAATVPEDIDVGFDAWRVFPPGDVVQRYMGDMYTVVEADDEVLRVRQVVRSPRR